MVNTHIPFTSPTPSVLQLGIDRSYVGNGVPLKSEEPYGGALKYTEEGAPEPG